jgi:invasion protein IalB
MSFLQNMALAAAVMAAVGSGAQAQEADTPTIKPEKFKDWDLFCREVKTPNDPRVCEMRTVIISKDGKGVSALAVASVSAPGEAAQVIASALVPLGVDLTLEPTMTVGEGKPVPLKFLRCLKRGCEAATPLSADQQAAMRAGSVAKVVVGIGHERTVTLEFSLSGFSAAHDALKTRTAAQ